MKGDLKSILDSELDLAWHLQYELIPEVSLAFVPAAREAITRMQAGQWAAMVHLPNGQIKMARDIVKDLNLQGFVRGRRHDESEP